jgi:hypothetical protein
MHAVNVFLSLTLASSSALLASKLAKCVPAETENQTNMRKTIYGLSCIILIAVIPKAFTAAVPRFKSAHMLVDLLFCLFVGILAIVNLGYLDKVKTETCSQESTGIDSAATKNLAVFVQVLSILLIVLMVKKLVWSASVKLIKSPKRS